MENSQYEQTTRTQLSCRIRCELTNYFPASRPSDLAADPSAASLACGADLAAGAAVRRVNLEVGAHTLTIFVLRMAFARAGLTLLARGASAAAFSAVVVVYVDVKAGAKTEG